MCFCSLDRIILGIVLESLTTTLLVYFWSGSTVLLIIWNTFLLDSVSKLFSVSTHNPDRKIKMLVLAEHLEGNKGLLIHFLAQKVKVNILTTNFF